MPGGGDITLRARRAARALRVRGHQGGSAGLGGRPARGTGPVRCARRAGQYWSVLATRVM